MTTKTGTANIGAKRLSGEQETQANPSVGSAHVTVSFDDTVVLTRSQLMAACKAIADSLIPRQ